MDHLTASVIGDVNCEVDTEIRQGPQVNGNQLPGIRKLYDAVRLRAK